MPEQKTDVAKKEENQAAPFAHHRDITLSHQDAQAGGDEMSIGGEEDPGVGLESLVENIEKDQHEKSEHK